MKLIAILMYAHGLRASRFFVIDAVFQMQDQFDILEDTIEEALSSGYEEIEIALYDSDLNKMDCMRW